MYRYLGQFWTLSQLSRGELDMLKAVFRTSVLGADEEIVANGSCLALFVVASGERTRPPSNRM